MNLNNAKVVTSKFLQLRDKLNNNIRANVGYDNNPMRAVGTSEATCNLNALQKAFGELCELLHELTVGEDVSDDKHSSCEHEWVCHTVGDDGAIYKCKKCGKGKVETMDTYFKERLKNKQ